MHDINLGRNGDKEESYTRMLEVKILQTKDYKDMT